MMLDSSSSSGLCEVEQGCKRGRQEFATPTCSREATPERVASHCPTPDTVLREPHFRCIQLDGFEPEMAPTRDAGAVEDERTGFGDCNLEDILLTLCLGHALKGSNSPLASLTPDFLRNLLAPTVSEVYWEARSSSGLVTPTEQKLQHLSRVTAPKPRHPPSVKRRRLEIREEKIRMLESPFNAAAFVSSSSGSSSFEDRLQREVVTSPPGLQEYLQGRSRAIQADEAWTQGALGWLTCFSFNPPSPPNPPPRQNHGTASGHASESIELQLGESPATTEVWNSDTFTQFYHRWYSPDNSNLCELIQGLN